MGNKINTILVLGLGKVGLLVASMLHETGFSVTGADARCREEPPFPVILLQVGNADELTNAMRGFDAVVSCLPYAFNLGVATAACGLGVHYFDLTEDVPTTRAIIEMSRSAMTVMAPQCGLAPGFIAIVGASLAKKFEKVRSIRLRVGALPCHPTGLLSYAFNWSPEGVVNEYLNDCEVIDNGVHKWVPSLGWQEKLVIDGIQLEAFTTSGGLGTMCETYAGIVENLDYKSIRYPGHAELMIFFFHELLMRNDRKRAGEILVNAKPPVSEDVVYVHASAEGWHQGRLAREEFVKAFYPRIIDGRRWRAISWMTAASVCSVIELVNNGTLTDRGFIKQEEIALEKFMETKNGRLYCIQHERPTKR
ncbi:MAG: saccharopine dehydrogenase C-terminal domain-containing protein [Desulfuromonadaceae bacterium]